MKSGKFLSWHRAMMPVIAVLMLAVALSGCKKSEHALLESVPASSEIVASVNLDKILKNAGCKFSNGNITLSDNLATLRDRLPSRQAQLINVLLLTAQTVDITKIIYYSLDGITPILTFDITKPEIFTALVSGASRSSTKEDDCTYYTLDDCTVAVSGSQGWVSTSYEPIRKSMVEAAYERPQVFSSIISWLDQSDEALSLAFNTRASRRFKNRLGVPQSFHNLWVCADVSLNDNILGAEMTVMDPNGHRVDISPYIGMIDTDFLRYVPDNAQMVLAFGKISGIESIYSVIRPMLGNNGTIAEQILPYIASIDGTTSLAANPASGDAFLGTPSLDSWDITAMTHLPQNNLDAVMSMISGYSALSGNSRGSGDINAFGFGNSTIYYGSYDGYLALSTREISGNYNNSFNTAVEGKRAALIIDVPYNSATMKAFELPYGVYFALGLEDTSLKAKFKFNGTGEAVLAALARLAVEELKDSPLPDEVETVVTDEPYDDNMIESELQPV